MTKKRTRSGEYTPESEQKLYLAFELGWSEWKLAFSTGMGQKARRRMVAARDLGQLMREIQSARQRFGLSASIPVLSCYEAGRDGFWLHRFLQSAGVENVVVDSSSIEVKRRARRAKSDRLDAEKLVLMLMRYHLGEEKVWSTVRVPSVEQEDDRQLHRELRSWRKERTRTRNRIRGLLATHGIRLPNGFDLSGDQLERLRLWDGSTLPSALKSRLSREWEQAVFLKRKVLDLETQRRRALKEPQGKALQQVEQLHRLRGIGQAGAWVLVREFFGWRKFRNRREVAALAGLTPTPYQSGDMSREQGISKSGNRQVRALMIELAWMWLRYQPKSQLARWYEERFGAGGPRARKVGIVAVARRLLIDLWRYLEWGVIPEGVEFKASA
jgi:transposase